MAQRTTRRATQRTQGMDNDDESIIEIDDNESDISVIVIDDTDDEKEDTKGVVSSNIFICIAILFHVPFTNYLTFDMHHHLHWLKHI